MQRIEKISPDELVRALSLIQRENRNLRWLSMTSVLLALLCLASNLGVVRLASAHASSKKDEILHVRGLIVEDANGVERLRLGAPLPDPMGNDGIRHPRKGPISGTIISDTKGTERGGYVTDDKYDEAFFSLDSRKGQEVLFLANPNGGTNLDLFDDSGNEAQLTVFPEGPKFVLKQNRKVVAQLPAGNQQAK
jgi:hypothetical protein